jgi:hypothetical protein
MHDLATVGLSLLSVKMLDSNEADNIGYLAVVGVIPDASFFDADAPNRIAANWYYTNGLNLGSPPIT